MSQRRDHVAVRRECRHAPTTTTTTRRHRSEATAKNEIVTGVCALLAPHVPKASTQFTFAAVATEDLAIDGLLLPDLIARDFPPAAAE